MNENKANRVLKLEQKQLKKTGERISKQMQLFDYALERGRTGEFMDARQDAEV